MMEGEEFLETERKKYIDMRSLTFGVRKYRNQAMHGLLVL